MNTEYTKIVTGDEARKGLAQGVKKLAVLVGSTLGPGGRLVAVQTDYGTRWHKDGVTVARSVKFGNSLMNMGAQAIKEVANKADKQVGDGTTTATVIANELIQSLFQSMKKGSKIANIKRGMEIALSIVHEEIRKSAIPITFDEKGKSIMKNIATISSNNDPEIPEIIMEAIEAIGDHGAIKIDVGKLSHCYVEKKIGLSYSTGMMSQYLAKNQEKMSSDYKEALIFCSNHKIETLTDIINIIEYANSLSKPLIIFCENMASTPMHFIGVANAKGQADIMVIRAPGFGSQQEASIGDIAIMTGGQAISKEKFNTLNEVLELDPETVLGRASSVLVKMREFTILGGKGGDEAIKGRIDLIKKQAENEESPFEKDKILERGAKLTTGMAMIYVGANSEIEAREMEDRMKDALFAVRAVSEDGYVKGAGVLLLEISDKMIQDQAADSLSSDENLGIIAVIEAIRKPYFKILENADIDQAYGYDKTILSKYKLSIDVSNGEEVNLLDSGIIDPAKVSLVSTENAVSVASAIISTNGAIYGFIGEAEKIE